MRVAYGVIVKPELPISSGCIHIEDLSDGYEVSYLSWKVNNRQQGIYRAVWVSEKEEGLIKRFKSVHTAKSYLNNHEPALLDLGCYPTEIELEELPLKPPKK